MNPIEENELRNAINTIEHYSYHLEQWDIERLMTVAADACVSASVCRDFIDVLCKRENELQDEQKIDASLALYKALEDYLDAGCTLGVWANIASDSQVDFDFSDPNDLDEFGYIELEISTIREAREVFKLPYLSKQKEQ